MSATVIRIAPALAAAAISTVTDLRWGFIYDRVLLPAAFVVCVVATVERAVVTAAAGALTAGVVLGTLYIVTKRRGIGFGDVKLAALLGSSTGVPGALEMLAVAFILGGWVALLLLAFGKKRRGDAIAFAPFLAAGFCAVLTVGTD